jgi:hypothetical protein
MQGRDESFIIQPLKIICTIIEVLFVTLALLAGLGSYALIIGLLTMVLVAVTNCL